MKITPEHYNHLKNAIEPLAVRASAHRQHLQLEAAKFGKIKDVEKRLRWDLLWWAKQTPWIADNIYPYADDDHIDTALRQIVKELGI